MRSFVLHNSYYAPISDLSDEELGRLFRSIFIYQIDGIDTADDSIKMAFRFFKNQMDLDRKKYEDKCAKNKENVDKRWQSKNAKENDGNQSQTNEYDRMQSDTNHTYNYNDNINNNDIYTYIDQNLSSSNEQELFKGFLKIRKDKFKLDDTLQTVKILLQKYIDLGSRPKILEKAITSAWKDLYPLSQPTVQPILSTKLQNNEDVLDHIFSTANSNFTQDIVEVSYVE
ncbi:DUF6291 domain-containing protein [Sulfurospirillum sp. 'SP']|nr:DUF6291 domain-containing protein [Sulfurospirillum sp. 'SP']WNZ00198.1 DUF6291 domain-containing protein [Sulfurospirillum sp. 'SP']